MLLRASARLPRALAFRGAGCTSCWGQGIATDAAAGTVRELTTPEAFDAAVAAAGPALLDFSATWCAPCKAVAPLLAELAAAHPGVAFYKIDIDNAALAGRVADHDVFSVPTFVGYRGGERLGQFAGADRVALQRLVAQLSGGTAPA